MLRENCLLSGINLYRPSLRQYNGDRRYRQLDTRRGTPSLLFILSLVLLVIGGCGGFKSNLLEPGERLTPRLEHFGLQMPYPVFLPETVLSEDERPRVAERFVPVAIGVDPKGIVATVAPLNRPDSADLAGQMTFLMGAGFSPGLRNGEPVAMTIAVRLRVGSPGRPEIQFPVQPDRSIRYTDLYWESFAHNGIVPASWISFPSYYFDFETQALKEYPYLIFRVELDTLGDVTNVEPLVGKPSEFRRQIATAIHWGDYRPLRIEGRATASTNFLVVALFPSIDYPTEPIGLPDSPGRTLWDRFRIRLFPDTVGLLMPALPKRSWSGKYTAEFPPGQTEALVSGRLQVDSVGAGKVLMASSDLLRVRSIFSDRYRTIRFYPALDFQGRPHSWDGLVYLRFLTESNVRIWFGIDPVAATEPSR